MGNIIVIDYGYGYGYGYGGAGAGAVAVMSDGDGKMGGLDCMRHCLWYGTQAPTRRHLCGFSSAIIVLRVSAGLNVQTEPYVV